jgi:signal peptidase II
MAVRTISFLLVFFLCAGLVGCDHATKHAAQTMLSRTGAVSIVPGVFDLRYAQNPDTAFSLSRVVTSEHKPFVLAAVASAMLVVVGVAWWRRRHARPLEQLGYALVWSGAAGNVIDRLARGYVVDFMHLRHWPIFNVADVWIVLGLAVLVVLGFRSQTPPAPA